MLNTFRPDVRVPSSVLIAALALSVSMDLAPAAPQNPVVHVRAWIDGRSRLELAGDSATWQHFDFAAPGRLDCDLGAPMQPTYLDGVAWWPTWPDVPTCENRDCGGCRSDAWVGVPTPLPAEAFQPRLTIVSARLSVTVVELPTVANGFRVVVEFDDNMWGGADWYEVELEAVVGVERYCPSTPNSSGAAAWIDLAGSRSVSLNDNQLLAGACPPLHPALFVYGAAPAALPLGGGTLCISPYAPGIFRLMPALFVRPDGSADCSLDMHALAPSGGIVAGSVWYFQVLFRDHAPGGQGVNLSDAIAVTFLP